MAVSDQDFKAAFSLLPVVIRLAKNLSTSPADPQQQAQLIQIVSDLQGAVVRCQGCLEAYPALDHTHQEQTALLETSRRELQLKCALIHKYHELGSIS